MFMFLQLIVTVSYVFAIKTNESSFSSAPNDITKCNRSTVLVTLLANAKDIIEDAEKYATLSASYPVLQLTCNKPMDCYEILQKDPHAKSGVHMVWPRTRLTINPIQVYCDMEDDGGGWTVIQRRGDFDSDPKYFYQDWELYKKGFGDLKKDFWLGNDNIYSLTNQRNNMVKFTLSDWAGNHTYATFDGFYIDDEPHKYTMHVYNYRGTAGDSFSGTNGVPFTTKDRDNDNNDKNCALLYKGAWWYTSCHASNLNGMYHKGVHESPADGVEWKAFRGHNYSLKDTIIKIRPKETVDDKISITPQ